VAAKKKTIFGFIDTQFLESGVRKKGIKNSNGLPIIFLRTLAQEREEFH